MELRAGYRQTEIGVIPNDWEFTSIGEKSIKIGSGITPTGGANVYKKSGLPFIRSQNVGWGNLNLDDVAYIDRKTHESFQSSELMIGDVLLNITGASIGRSAVSDERIKGGNVNQHVCIIRPDSKKLDSKYLNQFLLSGISQKKIESFQAGGNREGLNFGQIRSFPLALPPRDEQTAIANALSDADALIGSLQKLIAKKRQIKQGAMQTLLNPYENGVLKAGWCVKLLGDICDVRDGTHESPKFLSQGVPFVTSKNIVDGRIDLESVSFVSEEDANDFNRRSKVDKGDILMSMIGTIGNALLVVDEPNYCIKNVALIKPRSINAFYLIQLINSPIFQTKLLDNLNGGIQKFISLGMLRNIEIELPPLEIQSSISTVLSALNSEIVTLETKLAKYQQIKQGMMQNLLTGRIRLV